MTYWLQGVKQVHDYFGFMSIYIKKTNNMKQSPSGEGENSPVGQEIPCMLGNQLVHHHLHNSSPFIPVLIR
jgi:hypothetical protein